MNTELYNLGQRQRTERDEPYEPYPPRTADELRLTSILERVLRRMDQIESKIDALNEKNPPPPKG